MFQKTLAFKIFFTLSLILIGCFVFLPLLWMINTALKPADKTFTLYFFAGELTLDNILGILSDKTIMTYLKNSLIVSFLSSFMQLFHKRHEILLHLAAEASTCALS